jgi:hypothetical protein
MPITATALSRGGGQRRANMVGPPSGATRIEASIAVRHFAVSRSAFWSLVNRQRRHARHYPGPELRLSSTTARIPRLFVHRKARGFQPRWMDRVCHPSTGTIGNYRANFDNFPLGLAVDIASYQGYAAASKVQCL